MNLNNTIVILNGPPNSGKDVIANGIVNQAGGIKAEFKDALYNCTAEVFGLSVEDFKSIATHRKKKDMLSTKLVLEGSEFRKLIKVIGCSYPDEIEDYISYYITPRQALIYTSEVLYKPQYGKGFFGAALASDINTKVGTVISDGGFKEEIEELNLCFGELNVFIAQLERDGTSFEGDSRNYITLPDNPTKRFTNNGTIENVAQDILNWVKYERKVQQETFR